MLTKYNIAGIIKTYEKEIAKIKWELERTDNKLIKKCLNERLLCLKDNCNRHKLQAKAWGITI